MGSKARTGYVGALVIRAWILSLKNSCQGGDRTKGGTTLIAIFNLTFTN